MLARNAGQSRRPFRLPHEGHAITGELRTRSKERQRRVRPPTGVTAVRLHFMTVPDSFMTVPDSQPGPEDGEIQTYCRLIDSYRVPAQKPTRRGGVAQPSGCTRSDRGQLCHLIAVESMVCLDDTGRAGETGARTFLAGADETGGAG